ncbi:MAG: oxaloacetate decarboxylase [Hyphomicrobium sp.]|uniref:isocitrate lyase/PEP mutase family protein n=1 Tax=Hyphomicrobium sp. TaxID=82 RepID=UPI003D122A28
MPASQMEKGRAFRKLHESGCFVIPNPWDAGSAKLLAGLGFKALATTSAGLAFALGEPDGAARIGRAETIANVRAIVAATDLPVSADLEDGFGPKPEDAAETIREGAAAGLVGGSIEDSTRGGSEPVYEIGRATERVRAAAEVAKGLPFPFMLVGRAENYLHGRADIADTIRRLQAYQEAGADLLYAPGLRTREEIASVVTSVDRPVNVLLGAGGLSVADLASLGVRRISVGGTLYRAAMGGFLKAARVLAEQGVANFAPDATPHGELNKSFAPR